MKHPYSLVAFGLLASLLTACGDITRGQPIDHDRVASFQPGVTTITEVEQRLGPPLDVTHEPAGDTYLKYLYATARFSKYARIPLVSAFSRRGHAVYDGDTVYLHFDAQGRLLDTKEYTQHYDSRDPSPAGAIGADSH
jgi:outer membrane protein assembly factor BamE (lipoprotein component of BamABCDE complex)